MATSPPKSGRSCIDDDKSNHGDPRLAERAHARPFAKAVTDADNRRRRCFLARLDHRQQ